MFLRRSAAVKYFIAAILGAALYCECGVYYMQSLFWKHLECLDEDITCTRILFIADPQIQGEMSVPPPLSYLFNWDSDRYLKSTFSRVMPHFKPHVVVYLGDLMDEGSIASIEQFHRYAKRLMEIFVSYPVVQVWLPGDNDIGGENEPIKGDKITEFQKVFDQPDIIHYENISFYKVNAITHKYPKKEQDDSKLRIVVSHYDVTIRTMFANQVNTEIKPNIYFCAHDHVSKYVKQDKELKHRKSYPITARDEILNIDLSVDTILEIYVPTCSYRMGTTSIGFGAAVLDNNNQNLRYTVFWSPGRFLYLFLYLSVLLILILYCVIYCLMKFFITKKSIKRDQIALLGGIL